MKRREQEKLTTRAGGLACSAAALLPLPSTSQGSSGRRGQPMHGRQLFSYKAALFLLILLCLFKSLT